MNMTKMIVCGLMAVPMVVQAMPTKADLDKVSPVVADLMKPEQEALKAGKKSKSEVADAAIALVAQADGEAAKLLLLKGAFNLYVRDGQFDKALDTLKTMRAEVPDITPQHLANIIETALKRVPKKNGGQLYQILDETKTLARYQDELKKLEAQAKARPADKAVQTKLAEHYAVLGDWKKSLEHFAKGEDAKAAQMAKDEQGGAKDAKAIADFWWNYPNKRGEEFEKPFKQHAAALYSQAVASGTLVGLNKVQSERRIEEAKAMGEAIYEAPTAKDGLYCVIDLSGGPNAKRYPVSYLNAVPKGGWTDEYKTTKLVLRRIEPGEFLHQPNGVKIKLAREFYIGVFEVTQRQWELVVGDRPSVFCNDKCYAARPVETVSYDQIRGANEGAKWPQSNAVDGDSFVGLLRNKTKLLVDLPVEAQWEYACLGGEATVTVHGRFCETGAWDTLRWGKFDGSTWREHIDLNCRESHGTAIVGSYTPNAYGLYDMFGNVSELCNDWAWERPSKEGDSLYGAPHGNKRIIKGNSFINFSQGTTASYRHGKMSGEKLAHVGFRLAIHPPFVPPKKTAEEVVAEEANRKQQEELTKAKKLAEGKIAAQKGDKLYCVIDLSGGPNATKYPVSYLNAVPKGGWTDEYKTTKLVLRKIEPGMFVRESGETFKIDSPFHIGIFEVTQKQYELVMWRNPAGYKGDMRPVEKVSYEDIRGQVEGVSWPKSDGVDKNSFVMLLREKTSMHFDLPMVKQWEYACFAGTSSRCNSNGKAIMDLTKVGKSADNGGKDDHHVVVGSFLPNSWGLYDMNGNVLEWCLDRGRGDWTGAYYEDADGWENGDKRCMCGGCFAYPAFACGWHGGRMSAWTPNARFEDLGFRLAIQPPFVSPKK